MIENLPEELWLYILSFLRKNEIKPVVRTCHFFRRLANDKLLKLLIADKEKTGYENIPDWQLRILLLGKTNQVNILLKEAVKRVSVGKLELGQLRSLIACCHDNIEIPLDSLRDLFILPLDKKLFYRKLIEQFGTQIDYYSGRPEYANKYFRFFVHNLSKIDYKNIGHKPVVENQIIAHFILAHLTLLDQEQGTMNKIHTIFHSYFKINITTSQNEQIPKYKF